MPHIGRAAFDTRRCTLAGRIGEDAHLALDTYKEGVPMAEEDLLPELVAIAKEHFGATDKAQPVDLAQVFVPALPGQQATK